MPDVPNVPSVPNIDIRPDHWGIVRSIVQKHVPQYAVWAFGSRAKWTAKEYSDLDLAIITDNPLSLDVSASLSDDFGESDLPWKVDVVDWATTSESFREIIEQDKVVVQKGRSLVRGSGVMAGEWEKLQLRDACLKIGSGATPRGGKEAYKGGATSLIRSQNIYNEGFHRDGLVYINDDQSAALRNVEIKPNDVLLNITGDSVARCCQVAADVLPARVNQHVAIIRPQPLSLDARFLRYVLVSHEYQQRLHALASAGATRPALTKTMIEELDIPSPPLAEQKAIAAVLGALDDKIELNRRMNATLEAMARALFQSWFVDFDPVRAKLDARQPDGLDQATAALFPNSFQDSAAGHIPTGWTVCPLSILTRYLSRGIGPSYLEEGGVCVLNQKCVRDHRVDFSKSRRHDVVKKPINDRALQLHDVLVNSTGMGTLGRVAQVFHLPEVAIVDSHVTIVRAASDTDPFFLGIYLTGREAEIEELGEGSTGQTELSRARLGELKIITPPFEIQKAFGAAVGPFLKRISENEHQSRTLATLRDTLLPKLLSGTLRVLN